MTEHAQHHQDLPKVTSKSIPPLRESGSRAAMPGRKKKSKANLITYSVLAFLVLAGFIAVALLTFGKTWLGTTARQDLIVHKAKLEYLQVTVIERGTLESAENKDVICKVKAGSKGTFSSTIRWVIDDGTEVTKGQLLMELDDSALQDSLRAQSIVVEKARAEWIKFDEEYRIQIQTNEADITTSVATLDVSELDFEKYVGVRVEPEMNIFGAVLGAGSTLVERGEFKQKLDDVSGRLKQAQSDQEAYRDRAGWASRSVRLGYLTASQAKVEQSKFESSTDSVAKLQKEKFILEEFSRRRDLTDLKSKVEVARMTLNKSRQMAHAKEIQAESSRKTAYSVFQQELEKLHDIEEQVRECRIVSPQDGMVVYFKPEQNRGSQSSQGLIAQGEQVKEGQKLMRIPNLGKMQVNTRVHEAMVTSIRGETRLPKGVFESMRASMLTVPDPMVRLVQQHETNISTLADIIRTRGQEYRIDKRGQSASIRVDAMPGRLLKGSVRTVAAVASQNDFFSSDVKVYQTLVQIEDDVSLLRREIIPLENSEEGSKKKENSWLLKPDMSAEVTIHIDATPEPVLAIPVQAIVGGAEAGGKRKVYVVTPTGTEEREVELGLFNDKMVQVVSGLKEGDDVVLNPKVILGDKAKTREEASSKGGGKEGMGGEGKKGGDKKGKGGGGGGMKGNKGAVG